MGRSGGYPDGVGQLDLLGGGGEALDDDLDAVRAAAAGCTACELHALGTQTVFGEGPAPARFMLVGEQPGDRRISPGDRSLGLRADCSTRCSSRQASTARRCT